MPKTPDEIKMLMANHKSYTYSLDELMQDALALIQQLESDKQQLEGLCNHMNQLRDAAAGRALKMEERVHQLEVDNSQLRNYIRLLQAERDAALADFKLYRERNIKRECGVYACDLCKLGGKYEELEEIKCPKGCMGIANWQWRGVQKEE